jgi:hypothetical protein
MEPLQNQAIWSLTASGTSTTFTIPDVWDGVPPNYWTGGTFTIVESQLGGAELGCTGTIASNTGPNYPLSSASPWIAPTVTVSSPCNGSFSVGDIVIMIKSTYPTPESWWESGGLGGTSGNVKNGGQLLSDTTDLCATCGTQSLNMNSSASGSSTSASWFYDSSFSDNIYVLMNGSYQLSFWAKTASGTPILTASASRTSQGGFNCGTYTPKLTSSWAQYTWTCTASESAASTTPGIVAISFTTTGGSVYLDNVSFEKMSTNPSNTSVLRDEVIQTLQNYYGPSINNNPGMFRYWVNQNGENMDNWTQPDYQHAPTSGGAGYFVGPGGAGAENLSLEDYLVICQLLNAQPYLEVPVTFTTTDAKDLIEFLAGPSGTTYGDRRIALGQQNPWTSVFAKIHLSFCNECWNGTSFVGQSLPDRTSQPNSEYYYDYSVRAKDIFAAMRADSYYAASSFDLVMNAQTAVNFSMDTAIARAHPDSIEIEDYAYGTVNSFSTDAALWQPAMVDSWEKVTNPTDIRNFYQSVHDYQSQTTCGAAGTARCNVNIYEWGQGTISGSIDQTHLDIVNAGAGESVVMALQPLLNMQYYGIGPQSFFALTEFKNGAANGMTSKLWGNVIDMGGATNNVRPTFLGVQLINQSIIGPMYSCPISSNLTYNFAGSPNGNAVMPAMTNVPYLYAFCFENGTNRSLVLINTDLSSSHIMNFSGTNPPLGTVTERQLAPSSLNEMNEAHTGNATNLTAATVAIETSTLSNPGSVTLPPYSVTALDYTTTGTATAATPTFTPAGGTYAAPQSVTIYDAISGATIYYTTNGTAPTTASTKYSGAISVNATETLEAIAVAAGYTNSPAVTATYTINVTTPTLPAPTFSLAGGSYTTSQSVSISDATAGTTIYYTTDGTAPTTASTKYTGAITISATETLKAIAVETGYTNSPAATATYTINVTTPTLPAPTFSLAGGSYTTAQTVTISDATASTTIYYTTDGTAPTTASTKYTGAITISATETLKAIAVETGYTNSPAATATYTINGTTPTLPAPTLSLAGGSYTTAQTVTMSDATAGTTIYYTIDGTAPTTASTKYTGAITISATETLKAIAVETGYTNSPAATATYTINVTTPSLPAPTFSLAGGSYTTAQSVTLSDATTGTTIYYTTDGTAPTTASTKYTGAITISATETLEAFAVETGYANSPAATATYTISGTTPTLPAPNFSLAGGSYTTSQSVSISDATAGTTIYYSTDGTAPTTASTKYSGAITVSTTGTLEAFAVEAGYTNSPAATATYTISGTTPILPAPTFSLAGGSYTTSQSVTISDATAGTTIYYSTDGTAPTTASTMYTGAITVSTTETLKAIAVETGYANSSAATATYTISGTTPTLPAPTFSPAGGTYNSSQLVTISDATAGTNIYYTTNGAAPSTVSTKYTGAISVSATEVLKAIAIGAGYADSPTSTASYVIVTTGPNFTLSLSPAELSVSRGQQAASKMTLTPLNGFDQQVTFACNGLPAGVSCSFSPATVTPNGMPLASTLTITVSNTIGSYRRDLPFVPAIPLLTLCAFTFRKRLRFSALLFIIGSVLGLGFLSACGGTSAVSTSTTNSAVTITGTAAAGSTQNSTTISLTIQ